MAKKFYAVKKGVKPGIYESWNDCQSQINGYSGAVYKSFTTYDEAIKYHLQQLMLMVVMTL